MKTRIAEPRCFGFSFPHLDTLVAVETSADGVVVRTSRNTFSEDRKDCFIRELAAEGFIVEECRWRSPAAPGGLRWVVDSSAFMPDAACVAQTRRFMLRLLGAAALLWLVLMTALFLRAAG